MEFFSATQKNCVSLWKHETLFKGLAIGGRGISEGNGVEGCHHRGGGQSQLACDGEEGYILRKGDSGSREVLGSCSGLVTGRRVR